ncbi:putative disease resistance protein RGA3 [Setaria italica]|uniref:putative disease resistance protein RGA3 n=1 Tax=Setaria italica TaxID=4555 RepID=UPI000BE61E28|nr:putative disease resistance protein RGA3 [Setaria italica]
MLAELNEQGKCYSLGHMVAPSVPLFVDPSCLVGLDGQIEKVANMVMDVGDKPQLKIVFIVRMVGSEKTTPANEAFIFVGWKPDLKKTLVDMFLKLANRHYVDDDIHHLIASIREIVEKERCLIVVDDLWSREHWEIMKASSTPRLTNLGCLVRVLDLEGCDGPVCLDGLNNLPLLRYLSLRGTDVSELPAAIWELRCLETLDIRSTKVKELPHSIGALLRLRYLNIRDTDVSELPATIGELRYLETLDMRSTMVKELPPSIL